MSGVDFLVWLEQFRCGVTDMVFVGASALGSEETYMALLTIIYLCVGHRFGFHLFIMFLVSAYSNAQLKLAFDTPRPYELYAQQLHPLYEGSAGGASFPSGHAQNAAVVWGIIAIRVRSRLSRAAILLVIGVIAFSRLYCQIHWPVDVVGGLLIGLLLLIAYLAVIGAWHAGNQRLQRGQWVAAVIAVTALMYLLGRRDHVCLQSTGALLGSALGYLLLEGRGFKAAAPFMTQVLKVAVALALLFTVQAAGKELLGEASWAVVLRYALIGFLAAYLLPVFFTQFHSWRSHARRHAQLASTDSPHTDDATHNEQ